jgi:CheY-like chemotaxis protein
MSVDLRLQNIRVLAAEDDTMCRRVLGLLIRSVGFSPESGAVSDGLELTDKLSANIAGFGVIILDCNMARPQSHSKRDLT